MRHGRQRCGQVCTLLKLVAGATPPDDGTVAVRVGASVKMGYFAQHAMDLLDGEHTVFQSLEDTFPQAGQGSLRALAGCFGFWVHQGLIAGEEQCGCCDGRLASFILP